LPRHYQRSSGDPLHLRLTASVQRPKPPSASCRMDGRLCSAAAGGSRRGAAALTRRPYSSGLGARGFGGAAAACALAEDAALDVLLANKGRRHEAENRLRPTVPRNSLACGSISTASIRAITWTRYSFIHKIAKSRTPLTLARHRSLATSVGRKRAPELRHAPGETWSRAGGPRH
jgi:hypothetical protein